MTTATNVPAEVTDDCLFSGRVLLRQPARGHGYRVNVDALLLAAFAARSGRRSKRAVDLGAGVGAVAWSMLHADAAAHVTLVDSDPALCELARHNLCANGWQARAVVIMSDVLAAAAEHAGAFDLVLCNPPYTPPGRGNVPNASHKDARMGSVEHFVKATSRLVGRRARACYVYPAREWTTLAAHLRACGLEPKRVRFVHPKPSESARVVLVEAAAGAKPGGLVIEAPLFEHTLSGVPSDELVSIVHASPRRDATQPV